MTRATTGPGLRHQPEVVFTTGRFHARLQRDADTRVRRARSLTVTSGPYFSSAALSTWLVAGPSIRKKYTPEGTARPFSSRPFQVSS